MEKKPGFWGLGAAGSSVRREVVGGFTTFAAMAYIVAVNPLILGDPNGAGMPVASVAVATALAAALGCFLMAFLTNYPIALAPGMGTNAYFSFLICGVLGVPWQAALALTFWNGLIFLVLAVSGARKQIAESLPHGIQIGIQCGIGFFIAFIGLKNAGLVVESPATLVQFGSLLEAGPLLALLGLILMTVLTVRKIPGALLLGILAITVVGIVVPSGSGGSLTKAPESLWAGSVPLGEIFFSLDLLYPFREPALALPVLFTLLLLDLFDSIGTIIGVSRPAKLLDERGKLPKISRALSADALATVGGSLLGTSTVTSYVESAAGVQAGARTGLSTLVVGVLFLLAVLLAPLVTAIPAVATAPALVMVGLFMAQGFRFLDYEDFPQVGGAILTAIAIPLFFSITEGIGIGMIFYTVVMASLGRAREIPVLTYVIAGGFAVFFVVEALL